MRRPLNPKICNIALDANALDQDGTVEQDQQIARFRRLTSDGTLTIVVAGGVRQEVQHPATPTDVQNLVLPQIFNLRPGLNTSQQAQRNRVYSILQGNSRSGKHLADASHIAEAAETGCGYFITHDSRILNKREELASVLPPSLTIVTLAEFFSIYDGYDGIRAS